MSSLLFSTLWRRIQLPGSKNHIILLMVIIVFISQIQYSLGDIEPKPDYGELSTAKAKDDTKFGDGLDAGAAGERDGVHDGGAMPKVEATTKSSLPLGDLGFLHAFVASISVILVSELGDKTFFIAAIMAMRHPRVTVFTGAISALAFMTILSAVFGMAAQIIPRVYTYYISTFLFAVFGLKMLKDGYYMKPSDAQEELEEVQLDLRKREDELEKEASASTPIQDPESGVVRRPKQRSAAYITSRIFMQAFTMTFLAEWGDRSQLTTIILSAREDVYGVIVGGILGHSICTGLAVIGGRMIAQRISVRTVTLVGGVVFILFAISALFFNPNDV